jgi:Fe2+ or Zn2+ uptake regulation protein
MIYFIKRLLEKWSCSHKWDTYAMMEILDPTYLFSARYMGEEHTLICKKCGKIKKITL